MGPRGLTALKAGDFTIQCPLKPHVNIKEQYVITGDMTGVIN
jgi:hypothetical protein